MNAMMIAVVIGALLLGALGFAAWSGSQSASNGAAAPVGMGSGMMGSGNYGPMGSMMQGGMGNMNGSGMGGMSGGMMGQMGMMQGMGQSGGSMMPGANCDVNGMMGGQGHGPGMMGSGMMGSGGCSGAPQGQVQAPPAPQQSPGNKAGK